LGGYFPGAISYQSGEAVVVKLDRGQHLFALLDWQQSALAFAAFYPRELLPSNATSDIGAYWGQPQKPHANEIEASRKSVVLPRVLYPVLVTFGDVGDPTSVKHVKPDGLAAIFGAGYHLESIVLEITDETVTLGRVTAVLPWLETIESWIEPTRLKPEPELVELYKGNFKR
jgi:hypothetical protein